MVGKTAKVATARVPAQKKVEKSGAGRLEQRASELPIRGGETAWSPDELKSLYQDLYADAEQLRRQISEADVEFTDLLWSPGDGTGDDQADAGSRAFEREYEMSLAANSRELLAQIERAVSRIADGTYGVCERCSEPVGKARLQAFPRATLCMTCKQREERR